MYAWYLTHNRGKHKHLQYINMVIKDGCSRQGTTLLVRVYNILFHLTAYR